MAKIINKIALILLIPIIGLCFMIGIVGLTGHEFKEIRIEEAAVPVAVPDSSTVVSAVPAAYAPPANVSQAPILQPEQASVSSVPETTTVALPYEPSIEEVPDISDTSATAPVSQPTVSDVQTQTASAPDTTPVHTEIEQPTSDGLTEQVWISGSGKCYHTNPDCSGMKTPQQVTKEYAVSLGRTPCENCY